MNDKTVVTELLKVVIVEKQQATNEHGTELSSQTLDSEPYIRECGYCAACPFELPADGSECPGCRAGEQYIDDVPPMDSIHRRFPVLS